MIALIQRVTQAKVDIAGGTVGAINQGLLVLLGVEKDDNEQKAKRLCEKVCGYRIFSDEDDKMNLNVKQAGEVCSLFLNLHLSQKHKKVCAQDFRMVLLQN